MNAFLLKTTIFLLPLIVIVSIALFATVYIGEGINVSYEILTKNKKVLGPVYDEKLYSEYKLSTIRTQPPFHVVAIGSSRVLQIRKEMFDSSFFNIGFTVTTMADYHTLLSSIHHDKYPRFLLIGLDQWMFNGNRDESLRRSMKGPALWEKDDFLLKRLFHIATLFLRDIISNTYSLSYIIKNRNEKYIGLNGLYNKSGIRADGSFYYGKQIEGLLRNSSTIADYKYSDTYRRIESGTDKMEYGDSISNLALQELEKLLIFCKKNNIFVVAFLTPFPDGVLKKMDMCGKYIYIKKIYPAIYPIFQKYGFEVYDYSSINSFESNDSEMIDGMHGSEVTYLRLLIDILEKKSRLNECANVRQLRSNLCSLVNRYTVYP